MDSPIGWLVFYLDSRLTIDRDGLEGNWRPQETPGAFMVLDPSLPNERLMGLLKEWDITAQVTHYVRAKDAKEAELDYAEKALVSKSVATCWRCQGLGSSTTAMVVAGPMNRSRTQEKTTTCKECVGRGIKVDWLMMLLEVLSSWHKEGVIPGKFRKALTIQIKESYMVKENEKGVLTFGYE